MSSEHRWLKFAVRLAGTGIALFWLVQQVEWSVVVEAMSRLPAWAYAVPAVVVMFNTVLQAARLCMVFKAMDQECSLTTVLDCLFRNANHKLSDVLALLLYLMLLD